LKFCVARFHYGAQKGVHKNLYQNPPLRACWAMLIELLIVDVMDHINFAANKTESVRLKKRVGDNS
jgi:hypothetical protein